MKRVSVIFVAFTMIFIAFLINSIYASDLRNKTPKKKDQICLNRCRSDYKSCCNKAKKLKNKDRITNENECLMEKNTCIDLCP
jgi:hypothetical protein